MNLMKDGAMLLYWRYETYCDNGIHTNNNPEVCGACRLGEMF